MAAIVGARRRGIGIPRRRGTAPALRRPGGRARAAAALLAAGLLLAVGAAAPAGAAVVPAQFLITPTGLDFGQVQVGSTSAPQVVSITNAGVADVTMSLGGGNPGPPFVASQDCQGRTLKPGETCHLAFSFAPAAAGAAAGASIGSANGQPWNIALAGTGVAPRFLLTPTRLDFGPVQVGTTSEQQVVSIINAGLAPVVMSGAGGNPGGVFLATQDCQGHTILPGQACHLTYAIHPTAEGTATGNSIGSWNGQPYNIALAGTGVTWVDPDPPVVTCDTPAPRFLLGASPANVSATVTDAASGPLHASVGAAAATASLGAKTVALTGRDHAANSMTVNCPYQVGAALAFRAPAATARVHRGSTITVLFVAMGASGAIPDAVGAALGCQVTVAIASKGRVCATYDAARNRFSARLRVPASVALGSRTLSARIRVGTTVVATAGEAVTVVR